MAVVGSSAIHVCSAPNVKIKGNFCSQINDSLSEGGAISAGLTVLSGFLKDRSDFDVSVEESQNTELLFFRDEGITYNSSKRL